jgi:streptogramin lyase
VAVGAGSVWVSSGDDYYPEPVSRRHPGDGPVLRGDPETNRVVDRIPVDSPTGLAFGHGSAWVTSAGYGTVSRIDPQSGEVAAVIEVGRGAVDIATDERSGAVWVAGLYLPEDFSGDFSQEDSEYNKLSRVDPETNRVVAQIPIAAHSPEGGAQSVAVGKGAVWAQSGVGGKLYKVDPATNEVVARLSLGDYSSHLAVYRGAVWATVQVSSGTRLFKVDPRTVHVVASEDGPEPAKGGYGRVVVGGGYVWFGSGDGLARVAPWGTCTGSSRALHGYRRGRTSLARWVGSTGEPWFAKDTSWLS